jgi:hypothetical protein
MQTPCSLSSATSRIVSPVLISFDEYLETLFSDAVPTAPVDIAVNHLAKKMMIGFPFVHISHPKRQKSLTWDLLGN